MKLVKAQIITPFLLVFTFFAALQAQDFKPLDGDESPEAMLGEVAPKKSHTKKEDVSEKPAAEVISGIVRLIRTSPQTEVFFKDLKTSYIIPKDSKHNRIYEACLRSSKTGQAVALRVDPNSRRILGQDEDSGSSSGLGPASNSESQKGHN